MKPLLFFIFAFFAIDSSSQPYDDLRTLISLQDTNSTDLKVLNFVEDHRYWGNKNAIAFKNKAELKNFADSNKFNLPARFNDLDDTERTLALITYGGIDCHSWFEFGFERNDEEKIYRVIVYIYSGGCRAGGYDFTRWVSFTKIPQDYRFLVVEAVIRD